MTHADDGKILRQIHQKPTQHLHASVSTILAHWTLNVVRFTALEKKKLIEENEKKKKKDKTRQGKAKEMEQKTDMSI